MRRVEAESRLTIDRLCDEGCINVLKAFVRQLSSEYTNRIVQAKRHYNYDATQAQSEAIEAWNRWNKRRVEAA